MLHLNFAAVYAADVTGLIGQDGAIPWNIPEDMLFFRNLTYGHTVVMGRKTMESIGKRLPGRKIVVISSDPNYKHRHADLTIQSIEDLVHTEMPYSTVFIAGGARFIEQMIPRCHKVYVTRVYKRVKRNDTAVALNESYLREYDNKVPLEIHTSAFGELYSHQTLYRRE